MPPLLLRLLTAWTLLSAAGAAILPEELAAAKTWFDTLSWLDVRGKPYVEITSVDASGEGASLPEWPARGFLLSETDEAITILQDGAPGGALPERLTHGRWPLLPKTFSKRPDAPRHEYQLGIRRLSLDEAVAETLTAAGQYAALPERERFIFGEQRLVTRSAFFVLSRFCHQQERDDLALKLEAAFQEPEFEKPRARLFRQQAGVPFDEGLQREIYRLLLWHVIEDFSDPRIPRPELLAQCELMVRDFPSLRVEGLATEFASTLRTMIAEDEAHAKNARPLDQLSEEEQVREWIFRLRDQHGEQHKQPGECDLIGDYGSDDRDTPAHHLIALGYAAIPALIDSLSDPRPCRSVTYSRDFRFSHHVLNIGDCAEAILNRLIGERVYKPGHVPATASIDGETGTLRNAAQAWWEQTRAAGEKAFLAKLVNRADRDSVVHAHRLMKLDPAAALAALETAAQDAGYAYSQVELVQTLAQIVDPAPDNALFRVAASCRYLQARLQAVLLLQCRGYDPTAAVLGEWKAWHPEISSWGPEAEGRALREALWRCGDAGRQALASELQRQPSDFRWPALLALTSPNYFPSLPGAGESSPETLRAIEEACQRVLEQKDEIHLYAPSTSLSLRLARLCDVALFALQRRWPERYPPSFPDTRLGRDIEIAKARNAWRIAEGQSPLPVPECPTHPAAAAEPNTVTAIRWLSDGPAPATKITVGQPLRVDEVLETVTRLRDQAPPESVGVRFFAERPADGRGIVVELGWMPGPVERWDRNFFNEKLIADGEYIIHGNRSSSAPQPPLREDQRGMAKRNRIFGPGTKGSASWLILGAKPLPE